MDKWTKIGAVVRMILRLAVLLGSYPNILFKVDIPLSLRHVRYKRFNQKMIGGKHES